MSDNINIKKLRQMVACVMYNVHGMSIIFFELRVDKLCFTQACKVFIIQKRNV